MVYSKWDELVLNFEFLCYLNSHQITKISKGTCLLPPGELLLCLQGVRGTNSESDNMKHLSSQFFHKTEKIDASEGHAETAVSFLCLFFISMTADFCFYL